MRLPLPATTEGVRINLRAGEIPGQRQLPREGNRVIKGFQDGANLNVFQTRLERGAGNVFTYVQRARQGEISCPHFSAELRDDQQAVVVEHLAVDVSKINPTPAHAVRFQQNVGGKSAQTIVVRQIEIGGDHRTRLRDLALPYLRDTLIGRIHRLGREQVLKVQLVELQIQHPLGFLIKRDARLPLQGTVVGLEVERVQFELFALFVPHRLHRALAGDPLRG